jgi:glycolate oxidase FAD binding subunit
MAVARGTLWDLAQIVASGRARDATPKDALDGVRASFVVEPGSIEEASAALRHCSSNGLAVVVRGAGTKLRWGTAPERADVVLSTSGLHAVLGYTPGDLVVRAQPGVRLADLQVRAAAHGQMLALDPPEPAATLGGVVAAAASGPRRLRYGTPRDLLIGITVVLSDGTVAKAGGKVVKNVAGYDLCKLFAGSFGTLGLIVELIFRLHPKPEAARVLEVEVADPEAALRVTRLVTSAALVPSAVELMWPVPGGPGTVRALYEGFEPGVQAQAERAFALLGHPASQGLGAPVLSNIWPDDEALPEVAAAVRVKLAHPPAELAEALRAAWATGLRPTVRGHAATGVTFVDVDIARAEAFATALVGLRAFASKVGGTAVVVNAPADLKRTVDVWGPDGDTLALMRRVKERFDPTRTMGPGRFVGGI